MAESAVYYLLDNFAFFHQEGVNMRSGVRKEIEDIRDNFQHMTAFLRVADGLEESDQELKVWIKQLRDAAYDTKDVLDISNLHLSSHRHGHGFPRKISYFFKSFKARHEIASEVQRIKFRVRNIHDRYERYHYKYGMLQQGSSSSDFNNTWYDSRFDALLLEEAELVGIEKPKLQLIKWLVQGDSGRLEVISVVGMGGLGKTTLTKKVFDEAAVKQHFYHHVWITVSKSFKIEELLKDMIQQLFGEVKQTVPQGEENMNRNSLKGIINTFLQQKRYVIVFDDVWDIHAWEAFRFALPDCNCGSRVILTTRNADLASFCHQQHHGKVYNLLPLSPQESWTLFCRKTFQGNSCPSHLEEISRGILERCEGLPLAIVSISGLLSTKGKSVEEWERIYRNIGVHLEGNDRFLNMNKILSLSYFDLPYYLKFCFLYLSIFPEDLLIEYRRLIRLWIAEGFVKERKGFTVEEVAELYLHELISRSLIQVAEMRQDGRVKACRIHNLWREIIDSKSTEQDFVTIVSSTTERRQRRLPDDKVRRLSIHSGLLENFQGGKLLSRLRSLLVFGATDSVSMLSMLERSRGGLTLLNVLDMRGAPLETFPNKVVKLRHLRYLSLRDTKIKVIPKSIENLQNLETLDLKHTYVTELPDEILKLQRLRHILLYHYKEEPTYFSFQYQSGFKAPVEIGRLSSLQKLSSIEANHGSSSSGGIVLREIGKLTQLTSLRILKLRREDGRELCSSLVRLSCLRSLHVTATEEDEIIDLESFSSPPRYIHTLNLEGRLAKLPHWIPSLHNLVNLRLRWSKLRRDDDPLLSLQDLPNLVSLVLKQAYEGEALYFRAGGFKRLKCLALTRLKGLRCVRVEEGAMACLEELYISNCERLEELPSGIENLTCLKLLQLADMSDRFISKLNNREFQGTDYGKIAYIQDLGDSKDCRWSSYCL